MKSRNKSVLKKCGPRYQLTLDHRSLVNHPNWAKEFPEQEQGGATRIRSRWSAPGSNHRLSVPVDGNPSPMSGKNISDIAGQIASDCCRGKGKAYGRDSLSCSPHSEMQGLCPVMLQGLRTSTRLLFAPRSSDLRWS